MKAFKIIGGVLLLVIGLTLLFATLILPGMVRNWAVAKLQRDTGRQASIEDIDINPLTLTVKLDKFRLMEKDGSTPFASFSSARVSAAASSIVKGRPVLDEARVVAPYIHVVRTGTDSFNFSDIQKRLEEKADKNLQPSEETTTVFSLHDASLTNGTVEFIDKAAPGDTVSHSIQNITLSVPEISNAPKQAKEPVELDGSAVINGAPLKVTGKALPFATPLGADLHISLKKVNIPQYDSYIPQKIPLTVKSGVLSLDLDVEYAGSTGKPPFIGLAGDVQVEDVDLKGRHKDPLLTLQQFTARIQSSDLAARRINLDLLRAESFDVYLSRNRNGEWSYRSLADAFSEDKAGGKEEKTPDLTARLANAQLRDGTVHFSDRAPSADFSTVIRDITVDVEGLSTQKGDNAPVRMSLRTSKKEKATLSGSLSVKPPGFEGDVSVSGVSLADYYPYFSTYLTYPVKGTVKASVHVLYNQSPKKMLISQLDATLNGLYAPFGGDDFARIGTIRLSGGRYDSRSNNVTLAAIALRNGMVTATRNPDGSLTPMALLKETRSPEAGPSPSGKKEETKKELKYLVKKLAVSGIDVRFRDRAPNPEKPVDVALHDISAGVSGITGPQLAKMPYRFSAGYGKEGRIRTSGTLKPKPLDLVTHTVVKDIPLKDFAPYVIGSYDVIIRDGLLGADMRASLRKQGEKLTGSYSGSAQVRSFRVQHSPDCRNLLLWEMLRVDQVTGTLEPTTVLADRVLLSEYYANIVVNEDGTINLRRVTQEEGKGQEEPARQEPEQPAPKPDIRVCTVTLEDGVLDFKDFSLDPRRYATRFVQLGGRVSGLSSEPGTRAEVDLRGALENQSPLRISGQVNPLAKPLFVDLRVDFDNVALPRLTPYSAKYLGYQIEQGKLRATLNYRIQDRKIDATNRILIDTLFFGEEVESEQAVSLPGPISIPGVVGLLKGPKGRIELDVPVSGEMGSPDIGTGSVIWEAVKDAFSGFFRKIFTNPFSFLFGRRAEEFRTIYFDYGSPYLGDEQKRRLAELARKMAERPELKLDVTGYVDPERDPEGYRRHILNERMRMAKYLDRLKGPKQVPTGGHVPANVQVGPEERHEYLRRVYEQADFPKPRNMFGRLKDLSDEEMRNLLLAHIEVGRQQLRELSRLRSLAVRDFLSGSGKIDPSRLFLRVDEVMKEPENSVESEARVEFSLAAEKGG